MNPVYVLKPILLFPIAYYTQQAVAHHLIESPCWRVCCSKYSCEYTSLREFYADFLVDRLSLRTNVHVSNFSCDVSDLYFSPNHRIWRQYATTCFVDSWDDFWKCVSSCLYCV